MDMLMLRLSSAGCYHMWAGRGFKSSDGRLGFWKPILQLYVLSLYGRDAMVVGLLSFHRGA